MDKAETFKETLSHLVELNNRKNLSITGVKEVENFDDKEFFLKTSQGHMLIKGTDLQLIKLDTIKGDLIIRGKINSINYLEEGNKKISKESIISKLFK